MLSLPLFRLIWVYLPLPTLIKMHSHLFPYKKEIKSFLRRTYTKMEILEAYLDDEAIVRKSIKEGRINLASPAFTLRLIHKYHDIIDWSNDHASYN